MRSAGLIACCGLMIALLPGCAHREARLDEDDREQAILRHRVREMLLEPPAAGSALFGGQGLDPLASMIGRGPWPLAYRDEFLGESGRYYEFFYDVQQTPFPWYWGDSYTRRNFYSERTGAFNR